MLEDDDLYSSFAIHTSNDSYNSGVIYKVRLDNDRICNEWMLRIDSAVSLLLYKHYLSNNFERAQVSNAINPKP